MKGKKLAALGLGLAMTLVSVLAYNYFFTERISRLWSTTPVTSWLFC